MSDSKRSVFYDPYFTNPVGIRWFRQFSLRYQGKEQKLSPLQEKIQTQFGLEFLDQWNYAWDDLHMAELDRAFEQGFLAAFRLWMEISPALQTAPR